MVCGHDCARPKRIELLLASTALAVLLLSIGATCATALDIDNGVEREFDDDVIIAGDINVGRSGTGGELTFSSGALIWQERWPGESGYTYLGIGRGSDGTLIVKDANTLFAPITTHVSMIYVGVSGSGHMVVKDGAEAETNSLFLAYEGTGAATCPLRTAEKCRQPISLSARKATGR